MPWVAVASAVAPTIIGGLMGSEGTSQSTQQSIDPRMAKYIYGEDGKGGLLSEASKWYENNKTGLNPQMLQGLNTQWNVLNDPANMGAYKQMQQLGSGLMSTPIMGNPFSDGRASLSGNLGIGQPQMRSMQGVGMAGAMSQMQGMQDPRAAMAGMSMGGAMPQGGLLQGGSAQTGGYDPRAMGGVQQYQSYGNPGMGQPYTPQAPFVQPEWVTKPAPVAPTPAASPVDAERQRQQEEAAAMAYRY